MTTTNELRRMFLDFFEKQHKHALVASAPLVPPDDPSLLFTSAGVVQFKPLFAGAVDPLPYVRATTCQKCLRAGGKDSDLENVGRTSRHHTFFEMLGNFSFGDYYKLEALQWGWDFIWNHMKLPKDRLWATIFEEDDEAEALLRDEVGIPIERIIRLNAKENFWGPAGDTGACGPCSEVCFFMGTDEELEVAKTQSKDEIARRIVEEGDMFLEIWNMVFPQFDQQPDGSRKPLKNKGIDTGAGLERMTTAMQFTESGFTKIRSPYETDLLQPIVQAAARLFDVTYVPVAETSGDEEAERIRFCINGITDHVRALTFTLSEGMMPSNEGRGYVLRRILRRALRFGYLLGKDEPFLFKLVDPAVEAMGDAYPELKPKASHVAEVIRLEEERFIRTLAQGSKILDEKIAETKGRGDSALSGEDAFLLHATYGFPVDMTEEIAEDAGLSVDREGFEKAMRNHQEEARQSWKGEKLGSEAALLDDVFEEQGETEFVGYDACQAEGQVLAMVKDDARCDALSEGDEATVVLDRTPFYAESGGQVGDVGALVVEGGEFAVSDTQKTRSGVVLHHGTMRRGGLKVGDTAKAEVDAERRRETMRNHSVTHLMQHALKRVVGEHITQSGSFVGPEGLRFDFSHLRACTAEELSEVERIVNQLILDDLPIKTEVLEIDEARARGAIAPFGEKYGHVVRVVTMGDVSMEFCGGTHLERTGRIGSFRLLGESSVAAGIRRIEAVSGLGAYERWAGTRDVASELSRSLAVKEESLPERLGAMQDEIKKLQREVKRLKTAKPSVSAGDLLKSARDIEGLKVVAAKIDDADNEQLRALADNLRDKCENVVCVLGATDGKKVSLVVAVSKGETKRVKAGDIVKQVAAIVGGGGGGRPDMAQAGGKQPEKLDEAIEKAPSIIEELLK